MKITATGYAFINYPPSVSWLFHILTFLCKKLRGLPCLGAKLIILLQKISDSTYLPNWALLPPFRLPKCIKYHLFASVLDQKRAVDTRPMCLQMSWLVFPGVPCAQTASLHPAAQLFTQPLTTSPTLVQWCLKEGMPAGFSWHER